MARVAVDDALTPVRERLKATGFDVVGLSPRVPADVAAIVVNGLDDDVMGRQEVAAGVPVIDAAGRTAEEVARDVARRLGAARPGPGGGAGGRSGRP